MDKKQGDLVKISLEYLFGKNKNMTGKHTDEYVNKIQRDLRYIYSYLSEAIYFDEIHIFIDFVIWLNGLFVNIGLEDEIIYTTLDCISKSCNEIFDGQEAKYISEIIKKSNQSLGDNSSLVASYIKKNNKYSQYANKYLEMILNNQKKEVINYVLSTIIKEITIPELYIHVFQVIQREIGRLWHENKISVAKEHFASSVTQLMNC